MSLAEPAMAEAASCYDHEIIFCKLQDSLHQPHCSRKQSHANLASPCCGASFFPMCFSAMKVVVNNRRGHTKFSC